jgi:ribonuclease E
MTRQRIRPSLKRSVYRDCPACAGSGLVKTAESMGLDVIRLLILAAQRPDVAQVTITVAEDVAEYLNNKKRRDLTRLEDEGQMSVQVLGAEGVPPEHLEVQCKDPDGRDAKFSTG